MGSDRFPTASRRDVLKASGVLGLGVFGAQGVSSVASANGAPGDATDLSTSAWPQFGRTVGNASATDVDLTSSEQPYLTKRWTAEDDGGVPAQPVVANGTVFATSKGAGVIAFDLETGVERWRVDVDGSCVASPAVANGTVFVVTTTTTAALDVASGSTIWSVDRGGFGAPTVVEDTVYVAAQSPNRADDDEEWFEPTELAALSVVDGSTKWTLEADGVVDTTPAYAEGTVYVGTEAGVMAVDAAAGETSWTTSFGDDAPATTVTVDDGIVYGQSDGTVYALDASSGDEQWTRSFGYTPAPRAGSDIAPPRWFADGMFSVSVREDVVYVTAGDDTEEYDDRTLYALDASDGSTVWSEPGSPWRETGGRVLTAPTVAGDDVYVFVESSIPPEASERFNEDDPILLLALDAATGEPNGMHLMLDYFAEVADFNALAPVSVADDTLLATSYIPNGLASTGLTAYEATDQPAQEPPESVTVSPTGEPTKCEETMLAVGFPENEKRYDRYTAVRWTVDGEYVGTQKGFIHGTDASFDLDAGEHSASVLAYDRWGRTATASTTFSVASSCDPKTQSVGIEVRTDDPTVGEPVEFRAVVEGDDDLTYEWKVACGDETDVTGREASYTFDECGEWGIHLVATDTDEEKTYEAYTTVVVDDAG